MNLPEVEAYVLVVYKKGWGVAPPVTFDPSGGVEVKTHIIV